MYGADMGSLKVNVTQDNGVSWQNVWHKSGQQHTSASSWSLATISLTQYSAALFQLRFSGQVIGGNKGDISLDNISVTTTNSPAVEELDQQVDDISFTEQDAVELEVLVYSQEFVISGINTEIELSIENGEYAFSCQSDNYINETIKVKEGDSLCVRHISASSYQEQVTTVVTLAEQKFSFISITKAEPVVTSEPVITPEVVSPPESVTEPVSTLEAVSPQESVTEPITTPEAPIAPVAVAEEINTVEEQQTRAGSMVWLLLFGLVLRGKKY